MELPTSLWCVLHEDYPVRIFVNRIDAIYAVVRALECRMSRIDPSLAKQFLVSSGKVWSDGECWSIISVPTETV